MEGEKYDLNNYTLELVDLMLEERQRLRCDKIGKMKITERGMPGKRNDQ
jgi:hypothetical protein